MDIANLHQPQRLPLDRLNLNRDNPRKISEEQFDNLVTSLLDFPEMLRARPVVIDEEGVVLGGNMRTKAQKHLFDLPETAKGHEIAGALERREQQRKTDGEPYTPADRKKYKDLLDDLLFDETAFVTLLPGLTPTQKAEFILKDNSEFGTWDWPVMAEKFARYPFEKWGDIQLPADWGGVSSAGSSSPATSSGAGSDDGPGNPDTAPPKEPKNQLVVTFTDPEDMQAQESKIIELLETEIGAESFSIRASLAPKRE